MTWWLQVAALAALSLWLYSSTLVHLVGQWYHDPDFSHGFFVPLFSAYVVWLKRRRLARIAVQPSWSGLALLVLGLGEFAVGQLGAELFLARSSLLLVLAGLIVLFLGWTYFRALLLPLAFLILMVPIPAIIFNQITFPLQLLDSRLAATVLPWFGVPTFREGNVIHIPHLDLDVAVACSGIRSLLSLSTMSIIYGFLMDRRTIVRILLVVASIPIAVAANSLRIIGTGLLVEYWNPDKAEGFFHASWGVLIFVIALIMLYLLHRGLCLLWPEEKP
ncbi:MAG: exosortase/archaeosortase family protein [Candidatus Sulfotelmatobacter sp.]